MNTSAHTKLLLALFVQACIWSYLLINIQAWDQQFDTGWLSADCTAYFVDRTQYWQHPVNEKYLRFDLRQRTWKWVSRRAVIAEFPYDHSPDQLLWQLKIPRTDNGPYIAEWFDRDSREVLQRREVVWPDSLNRDQLYPQLIGNRFVVNIVDGRIDYLDLNTINSTMETLQFDVKVGDSHYLQSTDVIPSAFIVQTTDSRQGSLVDVDLFRFNGEGKLVHVRKWQTDEDGMTTFWGDWLITIPTGSTECEVWSLATDQLVSRKPLPKNFTADQFVSLRTLPDTVLLVISPGQSQWDLLNDKPAAPAGNWISRDGLPDGSLRITVGKRGTEIWDNEHGRVVCSWPINVHSLELLDKSTLLQTTRAYGISFYFHDISTGRLTDCYRPFGYVPWLCLSLLFVFAMWSYYWIRASARAGWLAWLDLLLVVWLPCLLITLFSAKRDSSLNYLSLLGLGISTGGLAVPVVWAMTGREPIWRRFAPLVFFELVNLAILWSVPVHKTAEPYQKLALQHFPLVFLAIYYQVMRMLALRLNDPSVAFRSARVAGAVIGSHESFSQPTHLSRSERRHFFTVSPQFALSDFFVLTLCIAGLLGIFRAAEPHWLTNFGLVYCLVIVIILPRVLHFGSSYSYRVIGVLACLGTAFLIIDAMLRWTLAIDSMANLTDSESIYTGMVVAVSAFVACVPLRYRGVRWSRDTSTETDEAAGR